jgi:hypothetical protein
VIKPLTRQDVDLCRRAKSPSLLSSTNTTNFLTTRYPHLLRTALQRMAEGPRLADLHRTRDLLLRQRTQTIQWARRKVPQPNRPNLILVRDRPERFQ